MRAWSFSTYDRYGTCPKQLHEINILKNYKEEKGQQQLWGDRVHKALELRVRDDVPLDKELAILEPMAARFAAYKATHKVLCEQKMALTKELKPTGYFESDVWLRAQGDIIIVGGKKAFVGDYKTGKRKYTLQLDLMAIATKAYFPEVEEISAAFLWLQGFPTTQKKFDVSSPAAVAKILAQFVPRLNEMKESEKLGIYPAKPSGLCRKSTKSSYAGCPVVTCAYNDRYVGLK